jgi:transposase
MPAKASGEVKTRVVKNPQKNGDIYVYERQMVYDPTKKQTKILRSKLLHKIPKGSDIPVPTRPKRIQVGKVEKPSPKIDAARQRVRMMDIIKHIGSASGIDEGIFDNTDTGTAQKILSVARYMLATNGQTLPGLITWQLSHPLPYVSGITEDIYHDMFVKVGRDESLQQNFFANRCATIEDRAILAYDSTTISTYSDNQQEARYGHNKAEDGLKTVKHLTLYSIETRQPVAFTKQPGNLPDVVTIQNALNQLSVLGLKGAEVITDNGYYSESNLAAFFMCGFDFITLVKTSIQWVDAQIDAHKNDFESTATVCPFDHKTHGITVSFMHEFTRTRKYGNSAKGLKKGDKEVFRRRVYLHLFFNAERKAHEDAAFNADLLDIEAHIKEGMGIDDLSKAAQKRVEKYLVITRRGKKTSVSFNESACKEGRRRHGFFALASNDEKNAFEALVKYRKRETIESFFGSMKNRVDGAKLRVWDSDTLRGRMFVQFVALCYYEYLSNEIRKMKAVLGVPNGDIAHDTSKVLNLERKLKTWLENTPVYIVLQWFDAVEDVTISSELARKRWSTEMTARDRMFLDYLGVQLRA